MAKVVLHGGVTYNAFGVDEGHFQSGSHDTLKSNYFGTYTWNESTRMLANFSGTLSGSNFEGSFENIDRFQIYKTIGEKDKLYKVYETDTPTQRVIEDFTVGDLCDYQYYIYPICKGTLSIEATDGNTYDVDVETIVPLVSDKVQMSEGMVSVVGLIQDDDDPTVYSVDEDNVWLIYLNLSDDGYSLNTDKTFYQTQDTYGKLSGGNRKQRSISISGLIGKFDCATESYVDTYDYIIDWETFAASNNMKMLIDLRGIITIGDIDVNPSFSYEETDKHEASVNFSFIQLNDIQNITVLGRHLPVNPLYYEYLAESTPKILTDTMDNDTTDDTTDDYHEYLAVPL